MPRSVPHWFIQRFAIKERKKERKEKKRKLTLLVIN
jgi:hypothetical protein